MYSRGYVENMVDKPYVPVCGCIEDMPPVSRSDCTEIRVTKSFLLNSGSDGLLTVSQSGIDDLEVKFNACQGVTASGRAADNDLASYVNKLVNYGLISTGTQEDIFKSWLDMLVPTTIRMRLPAKQLYSKPSRVPKHGIKRRRYLHENNKSNRN